MHHNRMLRKVDMRTAVLAIAIAFGAAIPVMAEETITVQAEPIHDQKAVFATVESVRVVPARVRTGGTIVGLTVHEGDHVEKGQVVAMIADQKLDLQVTTLDAQIAGLRAQLSKAEADLGRNEPLFSSGVIAKTRLEDFRTAVSVAANALKARVSERSVLDQQMTEGKVAAPTSGRILKVPVTAGSVVMAGETVAIVASQDTMVRLSVPERHARSLKVGDPIRLDGEDLTEGMPTAGTITLVYPQIEAGRVTADAQVPGLSDRFVGQRMRVWVSSGERQGFVIPESVLTVRFGLDYARLRLPNGTAVEVPVQRGQKLPSSDMPDGLEILSGLQAGDVLVRP